MTYKKSLHVKRKSLLQELDKYSRGEEKRQSITVIIFCSSGMKSQEFAGNTKKAIRGLKPGHAESVADHMWGRV